jgi:hypothetical protein
MEREVSLPDSKGFAILPIFKQLNPAHAIGPIFKQLNPVHAPTPYLF